MESVVGGIVGVLHKIFGSANERELKKLWPMVESVRAFYGEVEKLSDSDFTDKTDELRRRICKGESIDDILYEAYALCREASHRTLGEKQVVFDKWTEKDIRFFGHFDVQILGGIVLHQGKIAEMVTGEGKTLVATLPAYLNGLVPSEDWIDTSKEIQGENIDNWSFRPFIRETLDSPWVMAPDTKEAIETAPTIKHLLPIGKGVHVITTNDYLVSVGCEEMRPLYEFLGLTVGAIQADMDPSGRTPAYLSDITYGTNNEFGFDYLRDNLKADAASQAQRSRAYAIIDEVDSVLIDEARTPLIISGQGEQATNKYYTADKAARKLKGRHQNIVDEQMAEYMKKGIQREEARMGAEEGTDYIFSERDHSTKLTEQGQNRVLQILGINDLYSGGNLDWLHYIDNALKANALYKRDHHYVVKDGQIVIVDEFTGRLMDGRRWSDGLHQAVEAKEHLRIKEESQTIASITFQNFFKLYGKLSGMTGTAMTEAKEFVSIYNLFPVSIPTNRPLLRKNYPDLIFGSDKEKYVALTEHVAEMYAIGRPVLIGTVSIERSEMLSESLKRRGIPHEVLNAKHHSREAEIIADAGQFNHVTIATNMAGRGTDIKLGEMNKEDLIEHWKKWNIIPKEADAAMPEDKLKNLCIEGWASRWLTDEEIEKGENHTGWLNLLKDKWLEFGLHPLSITENIADLGGLHVVGTERHEARRIDNQLRGRCARQGDPGSSRFFLSLDDDLMRIFAPDRVKNILRKIGLSDGMPLEHGMVSRSIERAQRKVEERNFEIRKSLLEYDSVMNEQRIIVYEQRQEWLQEEGLKEMFLEYFENTLSEKIAEHADPETHRDNWTVPELCNWLKETCLVETTPNEITLAVENNEDIIAKLMEKITGSYEEKEKAIGEKNQRQLEKYLLLQTLDRKWMDHLYAMDLLKESIHLRGYAGQDPKLLYKREGYDMFQELLDSLRVETVDIVMKLTPAEEEDLILEEHAITDIIHNDFGAYEAEAEAAGANAGEVVVKQIVNTENKVGRNDPCICGSGKKYKKCCGKGH
ncbi:MAG: preprotein translocase subunit SecA [Planctomycetota bacterium]